MDTAGKHWLIEYHGCDASTLNDEPHIRQSLCDAAVASGATIVTKVFHRFSPQGVTGVVVVEESHLSIHTWPESGYAAVDFFTCGDCLPERAHEVLRVALNSTHADVLQVDRGQGGPGQSVVVHEVRTETPAPMLRRTPTEHTSWNQATG